MAKKIKMPIKNYNEKNNGVEIICDHANQHTASFILVLQFFLQRFKRSCAE